MVAAVVVAAAVEAGEDGDNLSGSNRRNFFILLDKNIRILEYMISEEIR